MGAEKMELLFTYGTFRDLTIQEAFFKRPVNMKTATLEGYRVFCGADGFFSISEEENAITKGFVLELYPHEMWIADKWEEVPFYEREKRKVRIDNDLADAWVYLKSSEDSGMIADNTEMSAAVTDEELEEEIRKFVLYQNTRSIPDGDFYLIADCEVADGEQWMCSQNNTAQFRKPVKDHIKFMNLCCASMKKRNVIIKGTIIGNLYFYLPSHNIQTRIPGAIYLMENEKRVTIILAFPCMIIDVDYVINAFETNRLLIETEHWKQFLEEFGMVCGNPIQKKYFVNGTTLQLKREHEKCVSDDVEWFYNESQNWYYKRMENQIESILTS
ncbi:hypothetical protein GH810_11035 [Acetobacterium paludosum]|uniref:Gamma-glutamylcyclotransferase AIG2-like domain-containing protein n=1 Tax=Acetobacterium paludosum TaxID=52693 RepID=A0A923KSY2_9FIRM|nr:gamma-glutamylcyclotransferase family protein [Acetobacterium paludosum]MBC3888847.1 hypothetical protein [Acetobacterium paludosum]